jgi:3-methyladenine DNA glycosylase AlkD
MSEVSLKQLRQQLSALASRQAAEQAQRFFKTAPGQYGAGDRFIGVSVPEVRALAKRHQGATADTLSALISSPIHEERQLALLIAVAQLQTAQKANDTQRMNAIADWYVKNRAGVNNWDLVDLSAYQILGPAWGMKGVPRLRAWAEGGSLWERRIAIITTYHFIRQGDHIPTFQVAQLLLGDREDLIHKAVGWMLREVGKRCGVETLERFLTTNYRALPRTTLRYAIERFPEGRRQMYLRGRV